MRKRTRELKRGEAIGHGHPTVGEGMGKWDVIAVQQVELAWGE